MKADNQLGESKCLSNFTHWHRAFDGTGLALECVQDQRIVERVELDVRELPNRPDLLARLGPITRKRLLLEARNAA